MASPLSGSLATTIYKGMKALFLDAVLTRDTVSTTSPDVDSFDPPAPTSTDYVCKAMRDTYSVGTRAGGLVKGSDVKVLILQLSLEVTPISGDRITIPGFGGPWIIVPNGGGLQAVVADPANATWECRCSS